MTTSLVTGGGGFIGRHLVRQLIDDGDDVRVLGRHHYTGLPDGVRQIVADITDRRSLDAVFDGVDVIYHVAALPGVAGRTEQYERVNIEGTQNVLEAALAAGVPRLVATSTPSVIFGRTGHVDADESLPYPDQYLADYPRTKAAAERRVLAASGSHLKTTAIRPHLVFGPGDTNLQPRVVERARRGRLRIVGDGKQPISVAYVENVAAAHRQAAFELDGEARCAGRAYFVNEPEPVKTGEWINTLLSLADQPRCERTIGAGAAYAAGAVLEQAWRWLPLSGEPPMTRFVARQLSEPHSFRTDAAERDFGYAPPVDWDTALDRTRAWATKRFATDSSVRRTG